MNPETVLAERLVLPDKPIVPSSGTYPTEMFLWYPTSEMPTSLLRGVVEVDPILSEYSKFQRKEPTSIISLNKLRLYEDKCTAPEYLQLPELQENSFPKIARHKETISVVSTSIQSILRLENYTKKVLDPIILPSKATMTRINRQFPGALDLVMPITITPDMLPEMALPILDFMEEEKPHIVIGCDRGARLFSVAMHSAWRETRETPFPTIDGKIHFTRVSKSEDEDVLQAHIDSIIENAMRTAKQKGVELTEDEQLRVMFVDDWVIGGGTKRLAERLVAKYGARTSFVVMSGGGADATGRPDRNTSVSWHDRPEQIGVNYVSAIRNNSDGTVTETLKQVAVKDSRALANRRIIIFASKKLTGKSSVKEKVEKVA